MASFPLSVTRHHLPLVPSHCPCLILQLDQAGRDIRNATKLAFRHDQARTHLAFQMVARPPSLHVSGRFEPRLPATWRQVRTYFQGSGSGTARVKSQAGRLQGEHSDFSELQTIQK